jgi:hypothetical protein
LIASVGTATYFIKKAKTSTPTREIERDINAPFKIVSQIGITESSAFFTFLTFGVLNFAIFNFILSPTLSEVFILKKIVNRTLYTI